MTTAIKVDHVSKSFQFWSERPSSVKEILVNLTHGKFKIGKTEKFFALKNISFEIPKGQFVGLMGRNGAGKSTLFKLISGIYQPTEGSITVSEQIAPLIELGAGFHPDLSGYENIFLNAAILGFGKARTDEALPAILAFAELGDKIHMPVKNYSSGMLVRLGFSIATHLTAPILLIDEVLAVGDQSFQKKCLEKIHSLHKEGRTILLITHDPGSIAKHCQRCLVIDNQQLVFDGAPAEGAAWYSAHV